MRLRPRVALLDEMALAPAFAAQIKFFANLREDVLLLVFGEIGCGVHPPPDLVDPAMVHLRQRLVALPRFQIRLDGRRFQ